MSNCELHQVITCYHVNHCFSWWWTYNIDTKTLNGNSHTDCDSDGISTVISDGPLTVFGYADGISAHPSTGKPFHVENTSGLDPVIF